MQNFGKAEFILFSGSSHPELASEIASCLGIELGRLNLKHFPDGEISLQIEENVCQRDVFVLQTIALNPNHLLMELLITVDALKRASAKTINVIIPYFGYSRQDRQDKPQVPITAKLIANILENSGVTSVLTLNLHADQIQGFFNIPVSNLQGQMLLANACSQLDLANTIVVAPDAGSVKIARSFAAQLGIGFAVFEKNRLSPIEVEVVTAIGDIEDKDVLLADDICSTAGTIVSAAKACREKGAKRIFSAIIHGLFISESVERIENSPIEEILVCNTIPRTDRLKESTKIRFVSIAPLISNAIQCILAREPVSSLLK